MREMVEVIRKSRIVVHGIGDAMGMARRRKMDDADDRGDAERTARWRRRSVTISTRAATVIHRMSTVGLRLEDIEAAGDGHRHRRAAAAKAKRSPR